MKVITTTLFLFLFTALVAEAQLRKDLSGSEDYTAAVTHTHPSSPGNWMNLLNMTMSHSYSMTFSNIGGQAQNLNAYTNSMFFDLSDKFDAQVDVSVLHSPFGNSFMTNNDMGARVIIDQARIDFKPSENTRISLQFSQNPYYSPYNRYGFGNYYSPYSSRLSPLH
ncbi:MAG: hypothetical protein WEA56_00145 [Balneolaceae bacterium]